MAGFNQEDDLPEGFEVESIPEVKAQAVNQIPDDLPEGFEVESMPEVQAPVGSSGYSGEGSFISTGYDTDQNNMVLRDGTETKEQEDDLLKNNSELYDRIRNDDKYKELREFEDSWGHKLFNIETENAQTGDSHVYSPFTGGMPTHLQELRKVRKKEMEDVYNQTGYRDTVMGQDVRIQETRTNNPYFDPSKAPDRANTVANKDIAAASLPVQEDNPEMRTNRYLVDRPDQDAITRMAYTVARNIFGGSGDLLVTGAQSTLTADPSKIKMSEDGPVSGALPKAVPNETGEEFMTEMTTFVLGPVGVIKGAGWGAKGIESASAAIATKAASKMSPQTLDKARDIYQTALKATGSQTQAFQTAKKYLSVAAVGLGLGVTEAVVAPSDSESMIESVVGTERIQKTFGVSPERARDFAMILEAPAIGTVLGSMGRTWTAARDKLILPAVGGLRQLSPMGVPIGRALHMTEREAGLATISWLDPNIATASPEQAAASIKLFGDALKLKGERDLKLAAAGKTVNMDTASAFVGVAEDYFTRAYPWKRDELGPEGFKLWVQEQSTETAERFFELRTTIMSGDGSGLTSKNARNVGKIKDLFYEGADSMTPEGVVKAQADSGEVLAGEYFRRDNSRNIIRGNAELDMNEARLAADNAITDDAQFRLMMDESTDTLATRGSMDDILEKMDEKTYKAFTTGKKRVDDAYKAITDTGAEGDGNALLEIIQEATGTKPKVADGRFKNDPEAAAMFEKLNGKLPEGVEPEAGEIKDKFLRGIAEKINEDSSIGNLYNEVRHDLRKRIEQLSDESGRPKGTSPEDIDYFNTLKDLKSNIEDYQIDFVGKTDRNIGDLVNKAKEEYRHLQSTFYANRPMGRVSNDMDTRMKADPSQGSKLPPGYDGLPQKQSDAKVSLGRYITSSLEGDQGREFTRVLTTATKYGGNDITPELRDYFVTKGLTNLSNAISRGDVQSIGALRNAFSQVKAPLAELGSPMIKEIERLELKIQTLENAATMKKGAYQDIMADMDRLEKSAAEQVLKKFVYKGEARLHDKDVGEQLSGLFKGKNSVTELDLLMNEIDSIGPSAGIVKDALRSTYTRDIFDTLESRRVAGMKGIRDGSVEDVFNMNQKNFDRIFGENSKEMANLKILFKDSPEAIEEIERAAKTYQLATKRSGSGAGNILGDTPKNLDPSHATNTMIYIAFGQLSRAGATARRFTGPMAVSRLDQVKDASRATLVSMLTDPKEFARVTELIGNGRTRDEGVRRANALILRGLTRTGMVDQEGIDETPARPVKEEESMNPALRGNMNNLK